MSSEENNMEALAEAVLAEAHQDVEQVLAEANRKADEIRKDAEKQAGIERSAILERARQEAETIRTQALSAAHMKARTAQLEQREALIRNVFETSMSRLPDVLKDEAYKEVAIALLIEALNHLQSDSAAIRADEQTGKLLTKETLDMVAKQRGMKLEPGKPLETGIGMVVQTLDGHREYDNTLETRLKRMQDSLRSLVFRLLMGETV